MSWSGAGAVPTMKGRTSDTSGMTSSWSGPMVSTPEQLCPVHGEPWAPTAPDGHRACLFYIPEFGASEDYGCPQTEADTTEADCG